jgi:hypothetical protein
MRICNPATENDFWGFSERTEKQALTTTVYWSGEKKNILQTNYSTNNNGPGDKVFQFVLVCMYLSNHSLSFNLSIYQVAGLENLASADPHSRLWQPEGQYMAEPSYVCRYVPNHHPKHQKARIAG